MIDFIKSLIRRKDYRGLLLPIINLLLDVVKGLIEYRYDNRVILAWSFVDIDEEDW